MLYILIIQLLLVLACLTHFIYQQRQASKKKLTLPLKNPAVHSTQKEPLEGMTEEILEALIDYKRSNQNQ